MAQITIDIDLPPELTVTKYQRHGTGHGFEVSWPLPSHCRCDLCHRDEPTAGERKASVQVVRDLDILGQPSFWIYQPVGLDHGFEQPNPGQAATSVGFRTCLAGRGGSGNRFSSHSNKSAGF